MAQVYLEDIPDADIIEAYDVGYLSEETGLLLGTIKANEAEKYDFIANNKANGKVFGGYGYPFPWKRIYPIE